MSIWRSADAWAVSNQAQAACAWMTPPADFSVLAFGKDAFGIRPRIGMLVQHGAQGRAGHRAPPSDFTEIGRRVNSEGNEAPLMRSSRPIEWGEFHVREGAGAETWSLRLVGSELPFLLGLPTSTLIMQWHCGNAGRVRAEIGAPPKTQVKRLGS